MDDCECTEVVIGETRYSISNRRDKWSYTDEQWARIQLTIQGLPRSQASPLARFQLERAKRNFQTEKEAKKRPPEKPPFGDFNSSWHKIDRLQRELRSLLADRSLEEEFSPRNRDLHIAPWCPPFFGYMNSLAEIGQLAKSRLESSKRKLAPIRPTTAYHCAILSVWSMLGGRLQVSRNRRTKKISGPMARFFAAVTEPVHTVSLESLPDIVAKYEVELVKSEARRHRCQLLEERRRARMRNELSIVEDGD